MKRIMIHIFCRLVRYLREKKRDKIPEELRTQGINVCNIMIKELT